MPRPRRGEEHPREEVARQIALLTAIGTPHGHVAALLRMSLDTIYKHYQRELDLGAAECAAVVGGKIFEAAKRGEQWACTLWAVRRMKWRESSALDENAEKILAAQQETAAQLAELREKFRAVHEAGS